MYYAISLVLAIMFIFYLVSKLVDMGPLIFGKKICYKFFGGTISSNVFCDVD